MSAINKIRQWFKTAPDIDETRSIGDQILYDSFNHLQNFVECHIAQIYTGSPDLSYKSRDQGLKGLDWLHSQKSKYPSYQAALTEIKVLYNWWVDLRPERTTAWEDPNTTYSMFKDEWLTTTEDDNAEYKQYMDKCRHAEKLQTLYNSEDTKMLLRLIQVRNYL